MEKKEYEIDDKKLIQLLLNQNNYLRKQLLLIKPIFQQKQNKLSIPYTPFIIHPLPSNQDKNQNKCYYSNKIKLCSSINNGYYTPRKNTEKKIIFGTEDFSFGFDENKKYFEESQKENTSRFYESKTEKKNIKNQYVKQFFSCVQARQNNRPFGINYNKKKQGNFKYTQIHHVPSFLKKKQQKNDINFRNSGQKSRNKNRQHSITLEIQSKKNIRIKNMNQIKKRISFSKNMLPQFSSSLIADTQQSEIYNSTISLEHNLSSNFEKSQKQKKKELINEIKQQLSLLNIF